MRVTRSVRDGGTAIEVDGAGDGRGAWLCRGDDDVASPECLDAALAAKQFARAWRTPLHEPDIDAIRRAIGDSHTDE